MKQRILLSIIGWLTRLTHERVTVDTINHKLIRPVPGLVIDGRQFYEFVQPSDMPQGRLVHYGYLRDEMAMGIDRKLLMEYVEKVRANAKDHNYDAIITCMFMLEDTLKNITTIESLYNLASLWYFDKTEDLSTYDFDYAQQKIAGFKAFPNKGFFFTNLLQHGLRLTGESLPPDIVDYLNKNAQRLKSWQRILSAMPG